MISRLRHEFRQCSTPSNEGEAIVTAESMAKRFMKLVDVDTRKIGSGAMHGRDREAIALRVTQLLTEHGLSKRGQAVEHEFVHLMLMANAGRVGAQISQPLKDALQKFPLILVDLQRMFEAASLEENDRISLTEVTKVYSEKVWRVHPRDLRQNSNGQDRDLDSKGPEQLATDAMEAMDIDGDDHISYAEFMAYCLGRRKHEVKLHMYDLTKGGATSLSWLLGDDIKHIWHTGLVVFDKEYFFSCDTVCDVPGETSFGEPTKVIHLGFTLWNVNEFHAFIVHELQPIFHRETYDVINNNCNHFTDRLAQYLVGDRLPEEVLSQSQRLMKLTTVHALRPMLNMLLRDYVVSRDSTATTIDLPLGLSLTHGAIPDGATVAIHPGWGKASAIYGLVCDSELTPSRRLCNCGSDGSGQGGCKGPLPNMLFPQCTEYAGEPLHTTTHLWVRYFDITMASSDGHFGVLRLERVPRSRISLVDLAATGADQVFRTAKRALEACAGSDLILSTFQHSETGDAARLKHFLESQPEVRAVEEPSGEYCSRYHPHLAV